MGRTISFEGLDNPAKRRISFNSSERSSPHTPESRLSADRDSRPLPRPFLGGTFGELAPENRHSGSLAEPVLDRHHSGEPVLDRHTGSFGGPDLDRHHSGSFGESFPDIHIGTFAEPALDRHHSGSFDEPVPENRRYGLFGEPNKDSQGEALDYPNDMSELSNYRCRKFSPRRSTPSFSQSPAISHQSPQKAFPVQSPKRKDSSTVSPRGVLRMDNNRGAFHSPKKRSGANKKTSPGTSTSLNTSTSPKFHSPKQHAASPRRSSCRQTLDNDFISQCKNNAPRMGLLRSPPMNSLSAGDESELPVRNIRNSNMSSQGGHGFENFSVKTGSSKFSRIAKPSGSKKVNKLKKPAAITSRKSISVNNSIDKDLTIKKVIKLNKPEDQKLYFKAIQESNPTDNDGNPTISDNPPPSPKHSSPSSSPELSSIFTAPKQKAKRRLLTAKDTNPPKLPPYRIPTPCKQLKVIRPCTPIAHSSNLRCKTPMSFQNRASLNIKRTVGTASDRQKGMFHTVAHSSKVPMTFGKLTVSLLNSSAGRVITTNPSQISAASSKASAIPTFQRSNMVQARCNNSKYLYCLCFY